jgi:hypothetical protein
MDIHVKNLSNMDLAMFIIIAKDISNFNKWSAANTAASARDVPAESASVIETNTTTTVDESNIGVQGAASAGDVPAKSTLVVERNRTTTVDESNINLLHDEIEGVHPEPSNDDEYNTGNEEDVSSARDDRHDGNDIFVALISTGGRSTTTYDESVHTQQFGRDYNADIPATIDASDMVATTIVTNSPQSRAISSASATSCNQELISYINRLVQDALRQHKEMFTLMTRSVKNLENKYKELQMRKKQRVNGLHADSLPTISTASDDLNQIVHFPPIDRGFIINAGLRNVGNTCYLNAYLQVIGSLTFLPECLSKPLTISSEKFLLYFSLATVISSMVKEDEKKPIVDPSHFIRTFILACNSFDNAFESFDQRKLHDSIYINQHDGRLLTLERSFNNC